MLFRDFKEKYNKEQNFDQSVEKLELYVGIKDKYEAILMMLDGTITVDENGVATIDHFIFELNLYYILAELYCDIEMKDEDLSDFIPVYDWFKKNKFYEWLNKVTKGDSNELQKLFAKYCRDEVYKRNAFVNSIAKIVESLNIEDMTSMIDKVKEIPKETIDVMSDFSKKDFEITDTIKNNITNIKDVKAKLAEEKAKE